MFTYIDAASHREKNEKRDDYLNKSSMYKDIKI